MIDIYELADSYIGVASRQAGRGCDQNSILQQVVSWHTSVILLQRVVVRLLQVNLVNSSNFFRNLCASTEFASLYMVDALDERYDRETLFFLRHQVPKLSGTLRILVTSRRIDDLCTDLLNADHIQLQSIDNQGTANQRDIAL